MKKAIRKYACRFILEFFAVFGITAILMVIYAIVTGGFIESFWGTCLLTVLSVALLILLSLGGELYKTTPARCIWQIHRDETGALRLFEWTDGHETVVVRLRHEDPEQIGGAEE